LPGNDYTEGALAVVEIKTAVEFLKYKRLSAMTESDI
jgi:hypothetical protein